MASTILHFVFPCCYPILDVRAMRAVGCKPNFNFGMWKNFTDLCRETADEYCVTLRDLDRALWTSDYMRTPLGSGPLSASTTTRRCQIDSEGSGRQDKRDSYCTGSSASASTNSSCSMVGTWSRRTGILTRAQGCLLGQIAGDSLGKPGRVQDTGRHWLRVPGRGARSRRRWAIQSARRDSPPTIPRWRLPWPGCLRNAEDFQRRKPENATWSGWSPNLSMSGTPYSTG